MVKNLHVAQELRINTLQGNLLLTLRLVDSVLVILAVLVVIAKIENY
jgi:hypothetical protein